jgi:16S rRNA (cytosine1402-N4)-methyltransferase
MCEAVIEALDIREQGLYVDCTFGRGGHSRAILGRLGPMGRLIAIDRDPEAVRVGEAWQDPRFRVVHAAFSDLGGVLERLGVSGVDGVLIDLGVSSPQLDDPQRGFSFRQAGPLDMRMDPGHGIPVRQWLLQAGEQEIARVIAEYGEERFAVQIAGAIAARVRRDGDAALLTTLELAELVAGVVRRRQRHAAGAHDPATRTFQALRIFINRELEELSDVLVSACERLVSGGRMAVISFHSLEDRLVKRFIAEQSGRDAPRDPVTGAKLPVPAQLRPVARVLPEADEVRANPRARSAVLRVAQRT